MFLTLFTLRNICNFIQSNGMFHLLALHQHFQKCRNVVTKTQILNMNCLFFFLNTRSFGSCTLLVISSDTRDPLAWLWCKCNTRVNMLIFHIFQARWYDTDSASRQWHENQNKRNLVMWCIFLFFIFSLVFKRDCSKSQKSH